MNLMALLLRGMPPVGLGVYLRDRPGAFGAVGARWAAVNGARNDSSSQVEAVGGRAWLYSTPEHWRPGRWEAGIALLERRAVEVEARGLSVTGIIADPETGWPHLTRAARSAELLELGAALLELAGRRRLGVTSYPYWPGLEDLHSVVGSAAWWSPQLYGISRPTPAQVRQWWQRWADVCGPLSVVPGVPGWVAWPEGQGTEERMRAFLGSVPASPGAVAWLTAGGGPPAHVAAALRTYEPGGSTASTYALGAAALLARPAGLVAVGVLVVVVALVVLGATLAARRTST